MMFIMIILSYTIISFIDLKATYHKQDKAKLITYFSLMTLSCAIGIASGYLANITSPGEIMKQIVFTLMSK